MFSPEFQVKQKFPLVQGQSSFEIVTLYISFFVLELNVICNNDSKIISQPSDWTCMLESVEDLFCYSYSSHY